MECEARGGFFTYPMNIPIKAKNKIKNCKALQGKTIFDVIKMDVYSTNLEAYIRCQREDREKAIASFKAIKKFNSTAKMPTHVIDHFKEWQTKDFVYEYMRILTQKSGCTSNERRYILQICQQAYNKTVADIVIAEFPDMKKYFYPQAN